MLFYKHVLQSIELYPVVHAFNFVIMRRLQKIQNQNPKKRICSFHLSLIPSPKAKKSDLPMLSACIGIDFGNTNTIVGINDPTELRIIENPEGFRVTPTMVAYTEDKQVLVGVAAKRQAPGNPLHTFYNLKNLLGAPYEEKKYAFGVKEYEKLLYLEGREGKVFPPVEVTSVMLNYMREIAGMENLSQNFSPIGNIFLM